MSRIAVQPGGVIDARYAFLAGLLDDAGLFPPASLTMPDAVARHAADRRRRGWLLGRLLCPASRLDELAAALDEGAWRIGVVSDGDAEDDLLAAQAFALKNGGVTLDAVEVRLKGADAGAEVGAVVRAVAQTLEPPLVTFLEVPLREDWEVAVPAAIAAIAGVRDPSLESWPQRSIAAKVRCGGVTPAAFPSAGQLAAFIVECVARAVPFKATAGLHHPVRRHDTRTGATMHGFYNVIGAATLLAANKISSREVQAVVEEEDVSAFTLDATQFAWRGRSLDPHGVAAARAAVFSGYGSCSIDEPVEDLTSLGVLPLDLP